MAPPVPGPDLYLTSDLARSLYHEVAAAEPIVDVHNHLSPREIAENHRWAHLSELWLDHDHYKWRAMRAAGVDEVLITGDADPWDRFVAWAGTVPRLIGNPLYVWTHLELQRAFGIDLTLTPATAHEIWTEANRLLGDVTAHQLLTRFDVELVATTDDPGDSLEHHRAHAAAAHELRLVPTFRPDSAHARLGEPGEWNRWADRLSSTEGVAIADLDSLLDALTRAHRRFAAHGARASDHGLACLPDRDRNPAGADAAIRRACAGGAVDRAARELVLLEVVHLAAGLAATDDGVLQLHLGPLRDASPRLFGQVGRDAGADVMGDEPQANGLVRFLGGLEAEGRLPRTVLYNLNPSNNLLFATIAGAYARPGVEQLVQWGVPWWFNDHVAGMRRHLDELAQVGQLAGFVGMLTDSRSILSMTRHELFRRVVCAKVADEVVAGAYPDDRDALGSLVRGLCAANARRFFGFDAG